MPQTSLLNFVIRSPPPATTFESSASTPSKQISLVYEEEKELVRPLSPANCALIESVDKPSVVSSILHKENTPSLLASTSRLSIPNTYISPLDRTHLPAVRRLTTTLLPVRYQDKFYNQTLEDTYAPLCRVVFFDAEPIGWIRCRLDVPDNITDDPQAISDKATQIYIQALCLLAPYRGHGLATALLDAVVASSRLHGMRANSIYAHVWENSEDALQWYERRGFKRILLVDQYYRRLKPSGAWIVRKELT